MCKVLKAVGAHPVATVYPEFVDEMGSHDGAVLLAHVVYWWETMGRAFWTTDRQLRQELRFTEFQLRRVKAKLKTLGYVKVTRKGSPCRTHYELNEAAFQRAMQKRVSATMKAVQLDENITTQCDENIATKEKTTAETTEEGKAVAGYAATTEAPDMKPGAKKVEKAKHSVEDVVTDRVRPKTPADVVEYYQAKPGTAKMYEFFWRSLLKVCFPDVGSTVPFTNKERGQVKALAKKLGPDFHEQLAVVFQEWDVFGERCKMDWGAISAPNRPRLGFALVYAQAIVAFCNQQKAKPVQPVAPSGAIPVPKTNLVPPPPKEKPATLEEMLAIEQELKNGNGD